MAEPSNDNEQDAVAVLAQLIATRISSIEQQVGNLKSGLLHYQLAQRDTAERLDRLEGEAKALRADIKELYNLVR
jgi:peptidoglycan hydrolase CwlO-like protein